MDEDVAKQVLDNIYDTRYSKYYWTISASRAGTLSYQKGNLEKEYQSIINTKDTSYIENEVKQKILSIFNLTNGNGSASSIFEDNTTISPFVKS